VYRAATAAADAEQREVTAEAAADDEQRRSGPDAKPTRIYYDRT